MASLSHRNFCDLNKSTDIPYRTSPNTLIAEKKQTNKNYPHIKFERSEQAVRHRCALVSDVFLGVCFHEKVHLTVCSCVLWRVEGRVQWVTEPEGMRTLAQLLQPPKPWTDEFDDPKANAPVPDPNPEKPLFWVPKPEVCWDKDPKVGAF